MNLDELSTVEIIEKINQEDIRILYFFNKDDNPKKIKLY